MADITFDAKLREKAGKGQLVHVVVKAAFPRLFMAVTKKP